MHGFSGKVLHINLFSKKYFYETPSLKVYKKYIGGKGLAGYYLKEFITHSWDSPRLPLLFFTGPLANTPSPASGRMTIMSRSPLTGTICDSSVGGTLAAAMKKAGLDGVVITGRSIRLCGIDIQNSQIRILDAENLKGLTVTPAISKMGKAYSCAVIGPAAENGVLFSSIAVGRHFFAGRGGLGAVMAAKNLKYIKVKGRGKTSIYNKDELNRAREKIFRLSAASPVLQGELGISNYGTGALYDLMHTRRMMPTNNFKATHFRPAPKLNAWKYKQRYHTKKKGCLGCHILCKKIGKNGEIMPEFETMSHFTALINNNDMETVVEANKICNETGMDTISAASTLACYQEVTKKNLSSKEVIKLLNDIAYVKGIGNELKFGSYRYAKGKNKLEATMSVKKQELPAYDPRGAYGMALAYAASTRGGCHLRAYPISHEILRKPVVTDRFSFNAKARIIKISEDLNAAVDSLTACKFLFFAAGLEEYAQSFYAVTGIKTTAQDLLKIGERIYYNERIMNAMNKFSAKDDNLPERFFRQAGTSGEGIIIAPIDKKDFLKTRANYYKIRGLDENAMPTKEKCRELGLKWKNF